MTRATSSIDPSTFASLALTHVQYDPSDAVAKILALVTLSPIFLLCSYITIILLRRELTFINALIGQLACEGLNWMLKRFIRQPRPTDHLGSGYGMPSSHSQFLGFFAAFFLSHFYLNRPPLQRPSTLINSMRRFEHGLAMLLIALLSLATCYSRYHLHYHTVLQIAVGFSIGITFGCLYYYFTEYLSRKPLRLPAPFAVSDTSSALAIRANRLLSPTQNSKSGSAKHLTTTLRNRGSQSKRDSAKRTTNDEATKTTRPRRRSSTLSDILIPELHPAPPLRQILLDHPIAVAFRIRDSWAVWKDGGIEGEYGAWRREWEARRRPRSAQPMFYPSQESSDVGTLPRHYSYMELALKEANQSAPTETAFCVGCVLTLSSDEQELDQSVLATGFSRELPGNTHAEQCALDKLESSFGSKESVVNDPTLPVIQLDLYTTMEPCSERLSGNLPCVNRILSFNQRRGIYEIPRHLAPHHLLLLLQRGETFNKKAAKDKMVIRAHLNIARVFQGVSEPDDFVNCQSQRILRDHLIQVHSVKSNDGNDWLEKECLKVARKGHPSN